MAFARAAVEVVRASRRVVVCRPRPCRLLLEGLDGFAVLVEEGYACWGRFGGGRSDGRRGEGLRGAFTFECHHGPFSILRTSSGFGMTRSGVDKAVE